MADIDDDLARGAIGEEILAQVKLVLEVVSSQPTRSEFSSLKEKLSTLTDEVKAVRAAVSAQTSDLNGHDARLADLSTTVEHHEQLLRPLKRRAA